MSIRRSIEARLRGLAGEWGMFVASMEVAPRAWDDLLKELADDEETYVLHDGGFLLLKFCGRFVHVSERAEPAGPVFAYDPPA